MAGERMGPAPLFLVGGLIFVAVAVSKSKPAHASELPPELPPEDELVPVEELGEPVFPDPELIESSVKNDQHIVRGDGTDWPWQLAEEYTGDPTRWPELREANPHLPTHPTWGIVYPSPGSTINLPPEWLNDGL